VKRLKKRLAANLIENAHQPLKGPAHVLGVDDDEDEDEDVDYLEADSDDDDVEEET